MSTIPNSTTEHTPPPWSIDPTDHAVIWGPDDLKIAILKGPTIIAGEDNAAFIVRACNSHDELVSALESATRLMSRHLGGIFDPRGNVERTWREIQTALANARGES